MVNQERIMWAFMQVADEYGVTLEMVLKEIDQMIYEGFHSKDKQIRMEWESIPRQGEMLTAVELAAYYADKVAHVKKQLPKDPGHLHLMN